MSRGGASASISARPPPPSYEAGDEMYGGGMEDTGDAGYAEVLVSPPGAGRGRGRGRGPSSLRKSTTLNDMAPMLAGDSAVHALHDVTDVTSSAQRVRFAGLDSYTPPPEMEAMLAASEAPSAPPGPPIRIATRGGSARGRGMGPRARASDAAAADSSDDGGAPAPRVKAVRSKGEAMRAPAPGDAHAGALRPPKRQVAPSDDDGAAAEPVQLHVRDVPDGETRETVAAHFSQFGTVARVLLNRNKHYATVTFASHADAKAAKGLGKMWGDVPLRIMWVHPEPRPPRALAAQLAAEPADSGSDTAAGMETAAEEDEQRRQPAAPSPPPAARPRPPPVRPAPAPLAAPPAAAGRKRPAIAPLEAQDELDAQPPSLPAPLRLPSMLDVPLPARAVDVDTSAHPGQGSDGLIGTCAYMCSDSSFAERATFNELHAFERDTQKASARELAVTHFKRSAAGDVVIVEDLRPPRVLARTLEHIFSAIIDADKRGVDPRFTNDADEPRTPTLLEILSFASDRCRAISRDIISQNYRARGRNDALVMEMFERMIRLQIIFNYECAGTLKEWHAQENANEVRITSFLKSLLELYDDARVRSIPNVAELASPNEAEFRAYYVLVFMADESEKEAFAAAIRALPPHLLREPPLAHALRCWTAYACNDYTRFWKLTQSRDTTFIMGALLARVFHHVRAATLEIMNQSYTPKVAINVTDLAHMLALPSKEAAAECVRQHGLTVLGRGSGHVFTPGTTKFTRPAGRPVRKLERHLIPHALDHETRRALVDVRLWARTAKAAAFAPVGSDAGVYVPTSARDDVDAPSCVCATDLRAGSRFSTSLADAQRMRAHGAPPARPAMPVLPAHQQASTPQHSPVRTKPASIERPAAVVAAVPPPAASLPASVVLSPQVHTTFAPALPAGMPPHVAPPPAQLTPSVHVMTTTAVSPAPAPVSILPLHATHGHVLPAAAVAVATPPVPLRATETQLPLITPDHDDTSTSALENDSEANALASATLLHASVLDRARQSRASLHTQQVHAGESRLAEAREVAQETVNCVRLFRLHVWRLRAQERALAKANAVTQLQRMGDAHDMLTSSPAPVLNPFHARKRARLDLDVAALYEDTLADACRTPPPEPHSPSPMKLHEQVTLHALVSTCLQMVSEIGDADSARMQSSGSIKTPSFSFTLARTHVMLHTLVSSLSTHFAGLEAPPLVHCLARAHQAVGRVQRPSHNSSATAVLDYNCACVAAALDAFFGSHTSAAALPCGTATIHVANHGHAATCARVCAYVASWVDAVQHAVQELNVELITACSRSSDLPRTLAAMTESASPHAMPLCSAIQGTPWMQVMVQLIAAGDGHAVVSATRDVILSALKDALKRTRAVTEDVGVVVDVRTSVLHALAGTRVTSCASVHDECTSMQEDEAPAVVHSRALDDMRARMEAESAASRAWMLKLQAAVAEPPAAFLPAPVDVGTSASRDGSRSNVTTMADLAAAIAQERTLWERMEVVSGMPHAL